MQRIGERFQSSLLRSSYDDVVIGSGISGLAVASILSKKGRKVLVLEQHYTAGGFTHTFSRKGFEWDVGLHYVGEVHRPQTPLRRLFDYISQGNIKWQPMSPVYDQIVMPDQTYDLRAGRENFIEGLLAHFPSSEGEIRRYIDKVRKVSRSAGWFFSGKVMPKPFSPFFSRVLGKAFHQSVGKTTAQVMNEIISDERLRGVLVGQWGDYGLPPSESSFAIHAMVVKHYLGGASYPVGGSSQLARQIVEVIQQNGGQVMVNCEVDKILFEKGKAVGLLTQSGEQISAKNIISSIGVLNTYQKLLREKIPSSPSPEGLHPSESHLCLYLGIEGELPQREKQNANLWIYPSYDHDKNVREFIRTEGEGDLPVLYISFPSAKDPQWKQHHPHRSTLEAITLHPYRWYKQWEKTSFKKRGPDYSAFKEHWKNRLIAAVEKAVPEIKGRIVYSELSTPLSTRHFCSYQEGEIYGVDHNPSRFFHPSLQFQGPFPHLFMTGQDIVTAGIGGALVSGALTAFKILGPLAGWEVVDCLRPKKAN